MESPLPHFRLIRHFAFRSLLCIAVAAAILGFEFRRITIEELQASAEANNVALTQSLANALWHQLSPLLAGRGKDGSRNADLEAVHQAVARQVGNLPVVKVKLYNLSGQTVFSTELKQIGDDMSANPGFLAARSGRIVSELTHQDNFSYFDKEIIRDRDLHSSYVPLRKHGGNRETEAVFEVYSDITADLRQIRASQLHMIAVTCWVLAALYLVLFLFVLRADRILLRQRELHQALQDRVTHMSKYDLLTQLPNRGELLGHLKDKLAAGGPAPAPLALMIVVVDNLKQINDRLGHFCGDRVLSEMAARLRNLIGETGFNAYYSDGKFAVALESGDGANHAFIKARHVLDMGRQPVRGPDCDIDIALGIGIALYPKDGDNADVLIRHALGAADEAQRVGPNHVRFYQPLSDHYPEFGSGDNAPEVAPA